MKEFWLKVYLKFWDTKSEPILSTGDGRFVSPLIQVRGQTASCTWWGFSASLSMAQSAPLTDVQICRCFPLRHTEGKGRREAMHGYELLFSGSCRTPWCGNRPFSQALGLSKPSGDDPRHPMSWKGGHSLFFSGVSFLSLGFYVPISLVSLSTGTQKIAI